MESRGIDGINLSRYSPICLFTHFILSTIGLSCNWFYLLFSCVIMVSLYDFEYSVSVCFWFMTAMFTALALFSRMAAAALLLQVLWLLFVSGWKATCNQSGECVSSSCCLFNDASVTFADPTAACVQNAMGEIMTLLLSQSLSRHLCLT